MTFALKLGKVEQTISLLWTNSRIFSSETKFCFYYCCFYSSQSKRNIVRWFLRMTTRRSASYASYRIVITVSRKRILSIIFARLYFLLRLQLWYNQDAENSDTSKSFISSNDWKAVVCHERPITVTIEESSIGQKWEGQQEVHTNACTTVVSQCIKCGYYYCNLTN